jgi:EAL domain-containing protein (putative c-di-GMP-specific phosphodiesterase class I)
MGQILSTLSEQRLFPAFSTAYQPIVNVPARRVVAYEALVRGENNQSYPQLIAGMDIDQLRAFNRRAASLAISTAVQLGLAERKSSLTLNMPPDLDPKALDPAFVREVAARFGLAPDRIILEVTEDQRVALGDLKGLICRMRSSGFAVAMDDFGAGYNGLTALVECRPEILKLDRDLIRDIDHHVARERVVKAFVRLAAALRITLIAEGVETLGECRALRRLGICYMQGYFFSRPVLNQLPRFEECIGDGSLPTMRVSRRFRFEESGIRSSPFEPITLQAGIA